MGPHSLHSPFLFSLNKEVLGPSKLFRIKELELLRKKLRKDNSLLEIVDFKSGKSSLTSVESIVRTTLSGRKFSSFLNLLVKYVSAESILETGTSLGINTLYLADSAQRVTTIEGSKAIASLAKKNFAESKNNNIRLVNNDLYEVLESEIVFNKPDFYFLDADHRSSATAFCIDLILRHTPNAKCIVIHDIYWSKDMKMIWKSLTEDPRFNLTIDIFHAGLLFPNLKMEKQHFTLRF